jgi:hypothetical protein
MHREFWWKNPRETELFGDLSVNGRRILRWIIRKWNMSA